MNKPLMHSKDMTQDNIGKIAALFPNCVTEHVDAEGKTVKGIDFDKLQQELSSELISTREERYQFTWPGKMAAIREANRPTNCALRPDINSSEDFWNTKNLYIEGDNLEVLKLLQENYLGKVKMIYIDPPYNTGNDFVYNDDFAESVSSFAEKSGMFDEDGNMLLQNFEKNAESNGRFHTDWLNMMYPRLRCAKNLLSEDGVIFISIDDCEVENMRKMCDEIFGESNFIAQIIWQKKFSRANDAKYFSTMHDYILCFCKSNILANPNGWEIGLLPRGEELPDGYGNPDNDPRGPWTSVILSAKSGTESLKYEIVTPSGRSCYPPSGRYWSCNKATFNKWNEDNRIWYGTNGDGTPRKKTFLSEVQAGLRPNTILFHTEAGNNQEAKQETKALFDGKGVFDGPKPVRLLDMLQTIANLKDDSIVLDFFSGSATTAHSVIKQNMLNGTNHKFILVQLPEIIEEETEAYLAGYKTICEIGEDRIRRAGKQIKDNNPTSSKYLDTGFRVLKLDSSNMKDVYYTPSEMVNTDIFDTVSNIKDDREPMDLLFQVMLEKDIPLSAKIEEKTIEGKKVYFVEDNYLVATFDNDITEELVRTLAKLQPYNFVMANTGIADDSLVDNFEQIFKAYSPETVCDIL